MDDRYSLFTPSPVSLFDMPDPFDVPPPSPPGHFIPQTPVGLPPDIMLNDHFIPIPEPEATISVLSNGLRSTIPLSAYRASENVLGEFDEDREMDALIHDYADPIRPPSVHRIPESFQRLLAAADGEDDDVIEIQAPIGRDPSSAPPRRPRRRIRALNRRDKAQRVYSVTPTKEDKAAFLTHGLQFPKGDRRIKADAARAARLAAPRQHIVRLRTGPRPAPEIVELSDTEVPGVIELSDSDD